jgi:hypothetical protein
VASRYFEGLASCSPLARTHAGISCGSRSMSAPASDRRRRTAGAASESLAAEWRETPAYGRSSVRVLRSRAREITIVWSRSFANRCGEPEPIGSSSGRTIGIGFPRPGSRWPRALMSRRRGARNPVSDAITGIRTTTGSGSTHGRPSLRRASGPPRVETIHSGSRRSSRPGGAARDVWCRATRGIPSRHG